MPLRGWNPDDLQDEVAIAHEPRFLRPRAEYAPNANMRSLANAHRVSCLQEIFPTTAVDMIEDVLATAQFHVDQAAVLLAELAEDAHPALEPGYVSVNLGVSFGNEEEPWDEVEDCGSDPEDWEVVDHHGNKVRTFADVLRTSNAPAKTSNSLPELSLVRPHVLTATRNQVVKHADHTEATPVDGNEEYRCVKSFGARRHRFLKKSRRDQRKSRR